MAGKPREPIDLILHKGKKHITKAEIEERRKQEIDVPFKKIKPPAYLSKTQKKEFKKIANMLLEINIYTELDADVLARYVISQDLYLAYTKSIADLIEQNDLVLLRDIQNMQDKAFKQAQSCARELGLTISSRCKLVAPEKKEEPKQNKFNKFKKGQVSS